MKPDKVELLYRVTIHGTDWLMSEAEYDEFNKDVEIIPTGIKATHTNVKWGSLSPEIKQRVVTDLNRRKW